MDTSGSPRLLILIVAYHAEATLTWVLERIPRSVFDHYACTVLVVDDASADRTFEVGEEYRRTHSDIPLLVLRNSHNQGYGGNQKIGYTWAIKEGFDFVALVHGDGQYAPEELPRLLQPLCDRTADAVFGSRMLTPWRALEGGMPLYKFIGNRILTTFQNALLRTRLSEFHSGYRIYSVPALRRIPFLLNSNDFHFDTEIIIQLLNARQRIRELPIPTYYGDELCRVDGLRYAANVALATLRNVAHRAGVLYQRRYEPLTHDNEHYDLKLGYASSHTWALAAVPAGESVIDLGAGPGGVASELARKECTVAVVDRYQPRTLPDTGNIEVFVQDLDDPLTFDVGPYRYILLLDVLEHLRDPELFLERLRAQFTHDTKTIVITTPNIAFIVQRLMLLIGQFNYGKSGILDRTHTRLFTFRGLRHLLRDEGFTIKEIRGVPAPFPKAFGRGRLANAALFLNRALIRLSKTLFSYQIFVIAESSPGTRFLVAEAEASHPETKSSAAAKTPPEHLVEAAT